MSEALRALIIEDSSDDAELMVRELRAEGYDVSFERVQTAEATTQALRERTWDVVLSDYSMPNFSAMAALKIVRAADQNLPFIHRLGNDRRGTRRRCPQGRRQRLHLEVQSQPFAPGH